MLGKENTSHLVSIYTFFIHAPQMKYHNCHHFTSIQTNSPRFTRPTEDMYTGFLAIYTLQLVKKTTEKHAYKKPSRRFFLDSSGWVGIGIDNLAFGSSIPLLYISRWEPTGLPIALTFRPSISCNLLNKIQQLKWLSKFYLMLQVMGLCLFLI